MHLLVSGLSGYLGTNLLSSPVFESFTITDIGAATSDIHYDCFIHFAWRGSPALDAADTTSNFDYLRFCYNFALERNIKHFIFLSSGGAIYGHPEYLPIDESHPLNPLSAYGIEKSMAEEFLLSQSSNPLSPAITILRPSNIYGGHILKSKQNGFINILSTLLIQGKPVSLINPYSMRDYLHINDFFESLFMIIKFCSAPISVFNVGSGVSHTPLYIFRQLSTLLCLSPSYETTYCDYPDPSVIQLDISSLSDATGWSPKLSIDAGLKLIAS